MLRSNGGVSPSGRGLGSELRGSLSVVIASSSADVRAGALATCFSAAYIGIVSPVIEVGAVLKVVLHVKLLVVGIVVSVGSSV